MSFKLELKKLIAMAIKKEFEKDVEIIPITYPEIKDYGDYSSTVALSSARVLRRSPKEIAEKIKSLLMEQPYFKEIEVAGPGYLNFFLSDSFLEKEIEKVVSNSNYGGCDFLKDKNILLEYVSANPTGPLHIGHGRWAAIGDSIANVLEFCGANVFREFYINDAGNQIDLLIKSVDAVRAGLPIPENGYHGSYINELARMNGNPVENILNIQKKTLSDFRVNFNNFFSEKHLHESGAVKETLEFLKKTGHCYENEGALWFKTTEFGDDKDRVLIKSDGEYTYFAVDIAYHKNKIERGFNTIVNILGADHHGYVNRLTAAVKIFSKELKRDVDFKIIIGQLVSLYRNGEPVRMSKRTGDMITLQEIMDEIGIDASRYFLVMRKADTPLEFDIEVAKKQSDENPVFYVQYAHARIAGILRNLGRQINPVFGGIIENEDARTLAVNIIRFPEICIDSAVSYEPHRITQYLENLASSFHKFYNSCRIITEDESVKSRRLALVYATKKVLATGLKLIGVSAPEKM